MSSNKPPHNEDKAKSGGASTAAHKSMIARNLRLVYGEIASEPVPDKIADLLNQLGDGKETGS